MRDKQQFPYEQIINYCKEQKPKEACGIVIVVKGAYKFIPCRNIADNSTRDFAIAPADFANAEDNGEVVTIVHSHPSRDASPSPTDIAMQKHQGIDWLIVGLGGAIESETCWLKSEKKEVPLYGRKYIWHVYDCGSFIRDFYWQEFNIELPDFYRPEKFWEQGLELYLDNYAAAGFTEISFEELKYGDLVVMALGTHITTHGAVYIGDNKIAHHLNGRLSCKDVFGRYYQARTTRYLRHKDM